MQPIPKNESHFFKVHLAENPSGAKRARLSVGRFSLTNQLSSCVCDRRKVLTPDKEDGSGALPQRAAKGTVLMRNKKYGSGTGYRGQFWCWVKSTVLVVGKEDGSLAKQRVRYWCWVKRTVLVLGKEDGSDVK